MAALKFNVDKLLISVFIFFSLPGWAYSQIQLSSGETVYVSAYTYVHSGPKKIEFQLATMLSIRNTDPKNPITVLKVDYYDNNGKIVDRYIEDKTELGPLTAMHVYIKDSKKRRNGPEANFIVKWRSASKVNQPIIETIMLGLASGQGLSFTCPGQIIKEHAD